MHKKRKDTILLTMIAPIALGLISNTVKVNAKEEIQNNCTRIWGEDRYETAVEVSKLGWSEGAESVFIVNGEDYADVLSAVPFAKQQNSPILLTEKKHLREKTMQELKRLEVSKVYIIGGQGAVSREVEEDIKNNLGAKIERVYGRDRYETSVRVAEKLGKVDKIFIASGEGYADALSAAGVAAIENAAIILTEKNKVPNCSKKYIEKNNDFIKDVYIVGGVDSVDKNIELQFKNVKRLAGVNRYETNREILNNFQDNLDFKKVFMAKGEGNKGDEFSDALIVSTLAAKEKAPVFLVNNTLSETLKDFSKSKMFPKSHITLLGGTSNVPDSAAESIKIKAEFLDENSILESKDIHNNADVVGDNLILKDMRIRGNLYIDSKNVILANVVVDGIIYVNTGDKNGVKFSNVLRKDTIILTGKVENIAFEKNSQNNYSRENSSNENNNNDNNDNKDNDKGSDKDNKEQNSNENGGNNENKNSDEGTGSNEDNNTTPEAINVSEIKLDRDTLEMSVGESFKIQYNILPENASNKNVLWHCDNQDILDISKNGIIEAKLPGQANIIVSTEDGKISAECRVIVKEVSGIELLKNCNSVEEVKKLIDDNGLNLNFQDYNKLKDSGKAVIASVIYEKKDIYINEEQLQKEIDTIVLNGYKIQNNRAILIEGVKAALKNAVDNPLVTSIYIPAGAYTVDSSININRDIKIQGEGGSETKIEIMFQSNPSDYNVGIYVNRNVNLYMSDLTIDGLYDKGQNVDVALESQGITELKNIYVKNIGNNYNKNGYGVKATAGELKVDNCNFINIQKVGISSSYDAVLNIGTNGGNIFEGSGSDNEISAILAQSNGETHILNNTIKNYNSNKGSGLKLRNGGKYTVKDNIITGNTVGISAYPNIYVNSNVDDTIRIKLLEANPQCKDNLLADIQIVS